uniref:NYN domain-containing protein n=1 Tax=Aegilops tauschii subsp. strangulata TaxID=200361 RepID=A0A453HM74_AEGTS
RATAMITAMYQALPRRGYPLLVLRLRGHRGLSSLAGGGERWRGQPQQQEESKEVKVSVWWDFQKCQLPPGANPCRVAPRVTAALRAAGIRGPVEITAFGDVFVLPRPVQEVLAATGVAFSHVPTSCVLHLRQPPFPYSPTV